LEKYVLALSVCGILLFLNPARILAQSERTIPHVKPSVLIAALPLTGSRDEGVRKVLASAMRFELERAGVQTLLFATTDEQALVHDLLGGEEPDPELLVISLMEFFSGLNHEFLALAGYIKKEEEIQVSFYIADLGRGEILASAFRRARIDFTLDEEMIAALRSMLPRAKGRIEEVAQQKAAEAAETAEAQLGEAGETVAEEQIEEQIKPQPPPLPEQPIGVEPGEEAFRPFEFSIGFAPFVPVRVAADVFALSYAPFVYGSYRIPLAAGILGLGLCTGLTIFDSEEPGLASYFHYVVPVGVDIRYTTSGDSRLALFARTILGAAVNVSDFGSLPAIAQEGLSRVMAHGSGGAGLMLAFSQNVGIAVDVMYEAFIYFYQEESGGGIKTDWIMGLVPAIYLYTRL
jgi:hypothetical protein